MAFMGVRISWLMRARKSDLARLAWLASAVACTSCAVRLATSDSRSSRYWLSSASRACRASSMTLKLRPRLATSSTPAERKRSRMPASTETRAISLLRFSTGRESRRTNRPTSHSDKPKAASRMSAFSNTVRRNADCITSSEAVSSTRAGASGEPGTGAHTVIRSSATNTWRGVSVIRSGNCRASGTSRVNCANTSPVLLSKRARRMDGLDWTAASNRAASALSSNASAAWLLVATSRACDNIESRHSLRIIRCCWNTLSAKNSVAASSRIVVVSCTNRPWMLRGCQRLSRARIMAPPPWPGAATGR